MNNYWLNKKEKARQNKMFSCPRIEKYAYNKNYVERYENTRNWLADQVEKAYDQLIPIFQEKVGGGFDKSLGNFLHCLALHGDLFLERVCNPKDGKLVMVTILPPETMFRIQTIKGNVVEFQQSHDGPDYAAMARGPIDRSDDSFDRQATAIRFKPEEIIHVTLTPCDAGGYGKALLGSSSLDGGGDLVNAVLPHIERMTGD